MIKVLIVEDDPMVAEFNKRYLEQVGGFKLVKMARSAKEALEFLEKSNVNLILLDIFMPGINGLELLAKIRESGKAIDVIVVSAACDRGSINKALQYGAIDYIIKPFQFDRFNAALSAYRERAKFMQDEDIVSQDELDQHIFNKDLAQNQELPKGLDRNTLINIWGHIQAKGQEVFNTEELANDVGISRVSIRKYLDFLHQIGILNLEVCYGAVGRPVYKYKCIDPNNNFIERY